MNDDTPPWSPEDLRAKVFEDRETPGDWRVEKMDEDGGSEVAIFSGPNARERATRYADREYGVFDEIRLAARKKPKENRAGSRARGAAFRQPFRIGAAEFPSFRGKIRRQPRNPLRFR